MVLRFLAVLVLAAALLRSPSLVHACAAALPARPDVHIRIADESAVIVWDAGTQTEHFIRQATFETNAPDFGFLVPTPTRPALAQADPTAFSRLETTIQPRIMTRFRHVLQPTLLLGSCAQTLQKTRSMQTESSALPPAAVSVVSTQRVGRYDAAVLAATDAGALAHWLTGHGYAASPATQDWLRPYVAAGWTITAFKIAQADPAAPQVDSSVVRMSFHTPQPFFPYREPADQRTPGVSYPPRLLRVFLLAGDRLEGTLGKGSNSWPGQTVWSDRLPDSSRTDLTAELALPDGALPPAVRLTTLEDHSSPRPGTDDVYFHPAANQSAVLPPPVYDDRDSPILVPVDLILLMVIVLARALLRARSAPARRAA